MTRARAILAVVSLESEAAVRTPTLVGLTGLLCLLCGCPQLMGDNFTVVHSVSEPSHGSAGLAAETAGSDSQSRELTPTASAGGAGRSSSEGVSSNAREGRGGGAGRNTGGADRDRWGPSGGEGGRSAADPIDASNGSAAGRAPNPGGGGQGGFGGSTAETGGDPGTNLLPRDGSPDSSDDDAHGGGDGVPEIVDCTHEVVLRNGLVAGFDDWNGAKDIYSWQFVFNSGDAGTTISGGFLEYQDHTGNYSLSMVPGPNASPYAVSAVNPRASDWGGGIQIWLHCIDASSFSGLEFWIKGKTPDGGSVAVRSKDTDYTYKFTLPAQWTHMQIPFNAMKGGIQTATGRDIVKITFSSQLNYAPIGPNPDDGYGPVPGAIEITVDSLGFYR